MEKDPLEEGLDEDIEELGEGIAPDDDEDLGVAESTEEDEELN